MDVTGYSSEVLLALTICGVELVLSHIGTDYFIIRKNDQNIAAESDGELRVTVDGTVRKKQVFIPHEIPAGKWVRVNYM